MSAWRAYLDLVRWDWVREMKRKETIITMVLFSLVTLMVFSFAIEPDSETGVRARAGVLWVVFLMAGAIGIDKAFRGGSQETVLAGLLLSPVSRTTIYYSRLTSTILFVGIMQIITFVAFCLVYNVDLTFDTGWKIAVGSFLATVGMVSAGITLSAMTRAIQGGDVLLRILLFPLLIPLFSGVVRLTKEAFAGDEVTAEALVLLLAFDLVYVAAGQILFGVVVSDFES